MTTVKQCSVGIMDDVSHPTGPYNSVRTIDPPRTETPGIGWHEVQTRTAPLRLELESRGEVVEELGVTKFAVYQFRWAERTDHGGREGKRVWLPGESENTAAVSTSF